MKKRLVLSVLLLVGLLGSVAWADTTVSFSTIGAFWGSPSPLYPNGISLSFDRNNGQSLNVLTDPGYAYATLGTFVIDPSYSSYSTGTDTFKDVPFTLTVFQSHPFPGGMGTFDADINGKIYWNGSTAQVAFDAPSVRIGDVIYTLTSQIYTLNASSGTSNGDTTIQAKVTVVPEPGSLMLLGSGLLGMGGYLRRRFFA